MSLFGDPAATYDPSKSFTENLMAALPPEDMASALGINNIDQAAAQANAAAAPAFGAGGSPFQFPQSAAFGAPLPPTAASPPQRPATPLVAADDDNDPIAVGSYQMPRIGSGFPDDVTPAPRQQPAPSAPVTAPSPLDTIGDRLKTSLQSATNGGGLIGGIASLVDGQVHSPQARALQLQQAALQKQVDALVNAGVPQKQAVLAVLNPEAAKSIIPQYVGPDKNKFVKIGRDGLGREQYGFVNEQDKTITPAKSPGGTDSSDGGLGDMSKTGAAYLATIPPQQRGIVQAMIEGRQPPPSSFALAKPYWQNMIAAAQNFDPTFDAASWSGRVAGVKDYASGKSAEMVRSANQALHHTNALLDSMDALKNGSYPALNWAGNKASEAMGSGEQGSFRTNAHAVADELGKMFKGGNLSDSEIHAWESNLSENMSPAQQRAQIAKLRDLLQGSLQALEEKRTAAIGPVAAEKQGPLIKEEGQKVLQRIDGWLKAGTGNTTKSGVTWSVLQ